jgi:hypothetical protein
LYGFSHFVGLTTKTFCHIKDLSGFQNPKGLKLRKVCHATTASPLKDWQSLNKGLNSYLFFSAFFIITKNIKAISGDF